MCCQATAVQWITRHFDADFVPLLVFLSCCNINNILIYVISSDRWTCHFHCRSELCLHSAFIDSFLAMQRYASMGTSYDPVSVCLCLSVTSRCSIEMGRCIELVFGM